MLASIDQERERLCRFVKKWGMQDLRTIYQSRKLDRLIYKFISSGFPGKSE